MTRHECNAALGKMASCALAAQACSEVLHDDQPSDLEELVADIEGYLMTVNAYLDEVRKP